MSPLQSQWCRERPKTYAFSTPVSSALRSAPDAAASPGAPGAPEGEGGAPAAPPNLTSNRRLQQTQAQVDEVNPINMTSSKKMKNKLDEVNLQKRVTCRKAGMVIIINKTKTEEEIFCTVGINVGFRVQAYG